MAEAEVRDFVGGLSEDELREMVLRLAHEVRNPLATIKAGVQLIQRLMEPNEDIARHLASVLTQVGRLDATVNGMQRFVRLGKPVPASVKVERAALEIIAAHAGEARRDQVTITLAGGPAASVLVDPEHLRTALAEVLANAVRHSPGGAAVAVSWALDASFVTVNVDDEGPGIPPEHADRVLRPFFSTSTHGTGLGLNIADRVCRLAGGRLTWRNNANRGCRFSLSLPEG